MTDRHNVLKVLTEFWWMLRRQCSQLGATVHRIRLEPTHEEVDRRTSYATQR